MTDKQFRTREVPCADGTSVVVEEFGAPQPNLATVVFVPALGVPLAYYQRLLGLWAGRGRHVVGIGLRGLPDGSIAELREASFSYTHLVRIDLPAVLQASWVSGPAGAVVVGHSLGGQIALLATASGNISPAAVITVATGTSSSASQRSFVGRTLRAVSLRTVFATTAVLGYWPGHRLGFAGRQPASLMRDWAYEARRGRYRLSGDPTDYESAFATLAVPVLMIDLAGDALVPARAVDHLAARLPAHIERLTLPDASSPERLHHVRWARRHSEQVVDAVEAWLARRAL